DHPAVRAGAGEDFDVAGGKQTHLGDMHRVVIRRRQQSDQRGREVRVDQEPHAGRDSGTSCSLTTAAANSSAARMSSRSRYGYSVTISSMVAPPPRRPSTMLTVTLRSRMHGTPPIRAGSAVIRSNDMFPRIGRGPRSG